MSGIYSASYAMRIRGFQREAKPPKREADQLPPSSAKTTHE